MDYKYNSVYGNFFRIAVLIGLMYLTYTIISDDGFSFLHSVDLIFHEAGHVLFLPFGEFMHFIGGTVFQIIIPLIFVVYFFIRKEYFGFFVMTWWLGENLYDVSVYMADARELMLPLLGNGDHDWNYILGAIGKLHNDQLYAHNLGVFATVVMIFSIIGAFLALIREYIKKIRGDR